MPWWNGGARLASAKLIRGRLRPNQAVPLVSFSTLLNLLPS